MGADGAASRRIVRGSDGPGTGSRRCARTARRRSRLPRPSRPGPPGRPTSTSCARSPTRFPTAGSRAPRTPTRARAIPSGRRGTRSRWRSGAGSRRSAPPDWAPAPARGAVIAPDNSPPVVGGLSPTRASSGRSGTLTGHGVRATGGRDAPCGATVAGVRRGRDGARGRVARARAGGPCGVPGAGRLQRDRRRELPDRQPAQRVGHLGRRRHEHPGLRDRHVGQPRRVGQLQGQHAGHELPDRHLPDGLLRRRRRAQGRDDHPSASLPQNQPACLDELERPRRLRQLGRVRVLGGAGHGRVGHLLRPPRAHRHPAASSHVFFVVRNDASHVGHLLPDLRHDLAGLQRLRRQQPLRRRPLPAAPAAPYKVSYNRPFITRGVDARPGLGLQRRVPDGPLAGAQRLRRQLRDGRRHRSRRRR